MQAEYVNLPGPSNGKFAMVLKNVFSNDECRDLIEKTERKGYIEAMVNVGGGREVLITDYRHSQRCIIDDSEFAADLCSRIQQYLPPSFRRYELVGLNERLRFLKYSAGDFFAPHCDGSYIRDNGERSFVTLMLYLNAGATGGSTRFHNSMNDDEYVDVIPEPGMVLIFQHDILHEGVLVTDGLKYAMRTDVMYARCD